MGAGTEVGVVGRAEDLVGDIAALAVPAAALSLTFRGGTAW